ncbi:tRNA (adenosine(37)-N6)-dimethylallyltransferase MiaA [Flavobacterium branchiophilum]|uniref:tRNA dimethylallyltransferase n=1 Tax=Flavobacterium branchiophilum TaxID=55197 RepID=A0A2H3KS00_9FLAO|nr:tRNA (adenosine(37)-N6)-dimethylallyltransferase MiaA [Flavobacterium branchiophilum]PDS24899.1 tRNA (adenosine(37)-N6)-dimethylallyltransferase MiaA [Flavobacterium branchiophilum]
MKKILVIVGPTAIGKTALAIQLAQFYNCKIISCDSRQFYKEMTIGTAVPSKEELDAVEHYFIQNKSIFEKYTVGDYEKEAINLITSLHKTDDYVIVVGGSGLYVSAILNGFDAFPEISNTVREKVKLAFGLYGIGYLVEQLQIFDFEYYEKIKTENPQTLQNPQRMMRFVEVCLGTGQSYSSFLNRKATQRAFESIVIGLEAERSVLYDRINQRVDLMVGAGLEAEALQLHEYQSLNALQTVGYKEFFDYFEGKISREFAIEEIKKNTRRFSKRQLTWFKKMDYVHWFDYLTSTKNIIEHINLQIK